MPEGLLIAGGIIGLIGGTIGIISGGWTLWERIAAARKLRKDEADYDINESFY